MTYQYPDWIEDAGWYFRTTEELRSRLKTDTPTLQPEFDAYFAQKYPEWSARAFHQNRMAAALSYIQRHADELDTGKVSVVGEETALISVYLMEALYRVYARASDEFVANDEPAVSLVLEFARESLDSRNKRKTETGDSAT